MKARKSTSGRRSLAVAQLRARRAKAKQQSQEARQKARDAKAQAKEARRLSKEAKKVARKAKAALQSIERKLEKLVSSAVNPKRSRAVRKKKTTKSGRASVARKASGRTGDATAARQMSDDRGARNRKNAVPSATKPEAEEAAQTDANNTESDGGEGV